MPVYVIRQHLRLSLLPVSRVSKPVLKRPGPQAQAVIEPHRLARSLHGCPD